MHADNTRLNIALGASGLEAEIASWHEIQRADNAFNNTSFPYQVEKQIRVLYYMTEIILLYLQTIWHAL